MGGRIGIVSDVGRGSTFWFELPFAEAPQESRSAAKQGPHAAVRPGLTVLVAEDNAINQKVARRFLEKLGCVVDIVENGEDAVAKVQERTYDAVFMDCQMPTLDGYEATRAIRQLPEHAGLPIIAMTAHAMRGDREKCLEAGMSDYLAKPLQPEALAAALARLEAPRTRTAEESAA
jgi:CheY-like chemotaxis protein